MLQTRNADAEGSAAFRSLVRGAALPCDNAAYLYPLGRMNTLNYGVFVTFFDFFGINLRGTLLASVEGKLRES